MEILYPKALTSMKNVLYLFTTNLIMHQRLDMMRRLSRKHHLRYELLIDIQSNVLRYLQPYVRIVNWRILTFLITEAK